MLCLNVTNWAREEACKFREARERQLYRRLLRLGAQLPPLHLVEGTISTECQEAVFAELQRRGAFDIVLVQLIRMIRRDSAFGTEEIAVSDSALWQLLRGRGYVWRPKMLKKGVFYPSSWSIDDDSGWKTVDSPGFREELVLAEAGAPSGTVGYVATAGGFERECD
ncbi:hypothetical protein N7G274_006045 [Stereocaulon virgatum]|uniref:Uncharacterized protein n=1 Tax=Stereocaulon virgatum TaxID=373712 RepID=A0ABR4A871_9LECA